MFNPFERFQKRFIEAFRKGGKSWLVSQSYEAARDAYADPNKKYLLFSHYGNLSQARIHYSAVKNDAYAAIIDLEKDSHREKIIEILKADSPWLVYSCLIASTDAVEKRLNAKYERHLRRYIEKNTHWRLGSTKTIQPRLDIAFGELFIILKYGSEQIRITLAELDKS